jgi:hypothetical protein
MNESYNRSLVSAVQKLAGTYNADTVSILTGKVLSVDENAGTCKVEAITGSATTDVDGVELQTVVADGLLFIPKVDSEVKIAYSTYTTPFIVQYGDLDKIVIAAETSIDIFCEDIKFNDGTFKGLVKVVELTSKLNDIEDKVNSIISTFNSHTHGNGNQGAPTTPPTSSISGTLTPTQQADIENPKIQH